MNIVPKDTTLINIDKSFLIVIKNSIINSKITQ